MCFFEYSDEETSIRFNGLSVEVSKSRNAPAALLENSTTRPTLQDTGENGKAEKLELENATSRRSEARGDRHEIPPPRHHAGAALVVVFAGNLAHCWICANVATCENPSGQEICTA